MNKQVASWSLTECDKKLTEFRLHGVRNSELVVDIVKRVNELDRAWKGVQDKHAALEQFFRGKKQNNIGIKKIKNFSKSFVCTMACLDVGNVKLAQRLFHLQ